MPRNWHPIAAILLSATTTILAVDNSWHPPNLSAINDLDHNLASDGVFDFIFDSSLVPDHLYGQYNYCNMPHVRKREYVVAPEEYELVYVEVIHRHHKRTPYQSNTFPVELDTWYCDNAQLYHYGQPSVNEEQNSANTFWQLEDNPFDLLLASHGNDDGSGRGFPGTCVFPQITRSGLQDSWQHGHDLFEVYHDLLRFLPDAIDLKKMEFRVTNNVITSQVAGMVIAGMYGEQRGVGVPLHVQKTGIDSLEPQYHCPGGRSLFEKIRSSDASSPWQIHLNKTKDLIRSLDNVSGVPEDNPDWHTSYDHYFDNLSSRLCHSKPLPCKQQDVPDSGCITRIQANSIFRLGQWEYSRLYRDAPSSLTTSVALYGVFIAELAQHLRDQIAFLGVNVDQTDRVLYRHNVAHDGSISRILSVLQIERMVWPGMGAEIAFELYHKEDNAFFVRVLWGGQVMRSSNPELGNMEFLDVYRLLDYFDSLVGQGATSVVELCWM
ncbi:hypothetical protein UA08_07907 [Talaromyces atroroseus]|uniref:Acid phosphatase n=1 Tax=Talaromyces atroroseus TaxID=1441469 RepID=A0A225AQQ1_TALAT|nr:hypothetical protein UA08_07907 [Talaromyces atroroseus]OKL56755.1 hypothetical protein UA08_07907 [Talaromyces atroroseus]